MAHRKTTNLDRVRRNAVSLLYQDIQSTPVGFVVTHPFTNTPFAMAKQGGDMQYLDLRNEDQLRQWRNQLRAYIMESDLKDILWMLNKPYILTMLHLSRDAISSADMGRALRNHWTRIENITGDVNVKGQSVLRLFRQSDPDTLMSERERDKLRNLPAQVTLYRGVTAYNKKYKRPFSWSSDREVALSFARRFQTGYGELWTITVPKERILCFFDTGESEYITDLTGYTEKFNIEIITDAEKEG